MFKINVPNKCSIYILTNACSDVILYSQVNKYMFDTLHRRNHYENDYSQEFYSS